MYVPMSVTFWNAIIIVGISITSLYTSHAVALASSSACEVCLNVKRNRQGFTSKGRGRGCTSEGQELVCQVSEGQCYGVSLQLLIQIILTVLHRKAVAAFQC